MEIARLTRRRNSTDIWLELLFVRRMSNEAGTATKAPAPD
jgi:hypothetical protein